MLGDWLAFPLQLALVLTAQPRGKVTADCDFAVVEGGAALSREAFERDYRHRSPLLLRNASAHWSVRSARRRRLRLLLPETKS